MMLPSPVPPPPPLCHNAQHARHGMPPAAWTNSGASNKTAMTHEYEFRIVMQVPLTQGAMEHLRVQMFRPDNQLAEEYVLRLKACIYASRPELCSWCRCLGTRACNDMRCFGRLIHQSVAR